MAFVRSCPDGLSIHRSVSYPSNLTCKYCVRWFSFSQNEPGLPYPDDVTLGPVAEVSSHSLFSSNPARMGSDLPAFFRLLQRKTTSETENEQLNLMKTEATPQTSLGHHNCVYTARDHGTVTGLTMEQPGLDLVITTLNAAALIMCSSFYCLVLNLKDSN